MVARLDTRLKQILREEGRRQDWLAAQVGATPDQMSRWCNGMHEPVEATREAIAEALGRDVEDVFPTAQSLEPAA